jgi:hypothetical protein
MNSVATGCILAGVAWICIAALGSAISGTDGALEGVRITKSYSASIVGAADDTFATVQRHYGVGIELLVLASAAAAVEPGKTHMIRRPLDITCRLSRAPIGRASEVTAPSEDHGRCRTRGIYRRT